MSKYYSEEYFLPIKGYEGIYEISNTSRVKSLKRKGRINDVILKSAHSKLGYDIVILNKNKIAKSIYIHRLVAMHFIANPLKKECVNHKDGNKLNNHISNLEWCTKKENNQHAIRNGLKKPPNNNGRTIFKNKAIEQRSLDKKLIRTFPSITSAAKYNNISRAGVSLACIGKYKTSGGYVWNYLKAL